MCDLRFYESLQVVEILICILPLFIIFQNELRRFSSLPLLVCLRVWNAPKKDFRGWLDYLCWWCKTFLLWIQNTRQIPQIIQSKSTLENFFLSIQSFQASLRLAGAREETAKCWYHMWMSKVDRASDASIQWPLFIQGQVYLEGKRGSL